MARKAVKRSAPETSAGALVRSNPVPGFPLGPGTLEILVMVQVRDGQILPWAGGGNAPEGRSVIDDVSELDLEAAKRDLFSRQISASSLQPADRTIAVRGSIELTEHALERAHRAQIQLIEDTVLPPMFQVGWVAGKIGVPKGSPAVRTVNLQRPEQ